MVSSAVSTISQWENKPRDCYKTRYAKGRDVGRGDALPGQQRPVDGAQGPGTRHPHPHGTNAALPVLACLPYPSRARKSSAASKSGATTRYFRSADAPHQRHGAALARSRVAPSQRKRAEVRHTGPKLANAALATAPKEHMGEIAASLAPITMPDAAAPGGRPEESDALAKRG